MAKRGRPSKKREEEPQKPFEEPQKSQNSSDEASKSMNSPINPRREGGKNALSEENQRLEIMQERETGNEDKSERDKVEERYMKENYGEVESEKEQEQEEKQGEEEQEGEEKEEEQEEGDEEKEEGKPITEEQYKAALNEMHSATTRAANAEKYMQEVAPFVKWDEFRENVKGEGVEIPGKDTGKKVEPPPLDLLASDYPQWYQKLIDDVANRASATASNQVSSEAEAERVKERFNKDFEDLPNKEYFLGTLLMIGDEMAKADPSFMRKTLTERYQLVKPKFQEAIATMIMKKPERKKIRLESPSKSKERELEKSDNRPLEMKDVEKMNRDYVKYKRDLTRKLQGDVT